MGFCNFFVERINKSHFTLISTPSHSDSHFISSAFSTMFLHHVSCVILNFIHTICKTCKRSLGTHSSETRYKKALGWRQTICLELSRQMSKLAKNNSEVYEYLVTYLPKVAKNARVTDFEFVPEDLAYKSTWHQWDDLGFYKHLFSQMGSVPNWNKTKLTALSKAINVVRLTTAHKDIHVLSITKFKEALCSFELVMKQLKDNQELWIM